jgi:hypothetical protein
MSTIVQAQTTASAIPATILLPDGCRPHKATSRDAARPALCHGYLRQRGEEWWLLTTDSYIACALKVTVTGDVQEGWVPRSVLKRIARDPFFSRPEQVGPAAWKVTTGEGRSTIEITPPKRFPDLEKIGVWDTSPGGPLTRIGLDPRLLQRLTWALGLFTRGVQLEFTSGAESPIRVTGGIHFPDRIGLQMPLRLDTK